MTTKTTTDGRRRHVFISHHFADDTEVDKLTALLQRTGYDVRNSSIRAKAANQRRLERGLVKDETIRRLLRMKISWAGRVIVLVGKATHKRSWVDWEIKQAHKQGKRIVGVYARGGTEADLPPGWEGARHLLPGLVGTSQRPLEPQSPLVAVEQPSNETQS